MEPTATLPRIGESHFLQELHHLEPASRSPIRPFRERQMIEYSTYLALLLSPFLTPASGKIHMATTMKTAVTMM